MELGTVISTMDSPTTNRFSFVIANASVVRKARFVSLQTEEGTLLGVVQDIVRANRYFERAESVSEYEKNGKKAGAGINSSFHDNFPTEEWEFAVAQCAVLGAYDTNLRRASFPAAPGAKVHDADLKLLKDFFAFEDNGINVGKLLVHDLEVKLNMNKLFQKHLAILGISGSGKCLPYEAPVFLSNGLKVKIGELAEEYFTHEKIDLEGEIETITLSENMEVLCLNEKLRKTNGKIAKITRRKAPNKLIKIMTRLGREVITTLEHPLLKIHENGPMWESSQNIKKGDYIAVPRDAVFGEIAKLDLVEFYKKDKKMRIDSAEATKELKDLILKKTEIGKFAEILKVNRRHLDHWLNSGQMPIYLFISSCELLACQELRKKVREVRLEGSWAPVPATLNLTFEAGWVIGSLMGDGHVGQGVLRFSNLDMELKNKFLEFAERQFGLKARISDKEACIGSETLVKIAKEIFGIESNSNKKRISKTIFSSNREFIRGFLSGLFDSDGTVSKTTPEMSYCSASKDLAMNVSNLLLKFGIISSLKPKFDKKYQKNYYNVHIYGQMGLVAFGNNIGFLKSEKQQRLQKWGSGVKNTNVDVIPFAVKLVEKCSFGLKTTPTEICRRSGLSDSMMANAKLTRKTIGRETLSKIAIALKDRRDELSKNIQIAKNVKTPDVNSFANSIKTLKRVYSNNPYEYGEIAKGTKISAPTVARMLTGRTEPTGNIAELSKGMLSLPLPEDEATEIHSIVGSLAEADSIGIQKLFRISEGIGCPLDKLSAFCGLWKGACADFESGRRKPNAVQKASIIYGIKLAAMEIEKDAQKASETLLEIENLAFSSIFWDTVQEIKYETYDGKYVYDLEIEENHNFFAGETPVIVHNSVATAVMIEELLSRTKEQGRLAAVVFDAHGEYVSFSDKKHNSEFADKVTVVNANKVQIAAKNLSPSLISRLLPGISHTQMRDLAPILEKMKKEVRDGGDAFGLEQIVQRVQASDMKENVKDALLSWLFELRNLKIVGEHDAPQLKKTIKAGNLAVFDLSGIVNMLKKQIIVSYISEKMFALRRKDELPPYVMIVEEAHNFAPEKAEKKYAISKGVINTVAREGRKFGASLCLISQRPVQLSTTALSQCNTMLIMRITNPYDLKHIAESAEAIDADTQNQISSLRVGEGVLIGEAVNYPVFVRIRNRKTKKLSKGESLEELAKRFEEKQSLAEAISDADVNDAFLQ